jgi:hypothetical protein
MSRMKHESACVLPCRTGNRELALGPVGVLVSAVRGGNLRYKAGDGSSLRYAVPFPASLPRMAQPHSARRPVEGLVPVFATPDKWDALRARARVRLP